MNCLQLVQVWYCGLSSVGLSVALWVVFSWLKCCTLDCLQLVQVWHCGLSSVGSSVALWTVFVWLKCGNVDCLHLAQDRFEWSAGDNQHSSSIKAGEIVII